MKTLKDNKKIYLDYAGATPMNPLVYKMISSYQEHYFANPSAVYDLGVEARGVINESRLTISKLIGAHSDEIIFTGSGTESDALAIVGVVLNYKIQNINKNSKKVIPHIITTKIEHPAVLENCRFLENLGLAQVTYISVKENGIIDPKDIKDALKHNTILVSVMYANNEIGTIQPIKEISKIIRHFKKINLKNQPLNSEFPLFHTDACQAINYLPVENIEKLGVDLLSFNGSKIYGPKGIGVLYKKRNVKLSALYQGGGQEFGLRSGTENVSYILGVAISLEETFKIKKKESLRLIKLRNYTIEKLIKLNISPFKIILNGDQEKRLPNNINISISDISSELLVIELDALGIKVSEKSACHSSDENSSYVIKAIRKKCKRRKNSIEGSLRISLGRPTTKKDLNVLVASLKTILNKYKDWK